MNFLVNVLQIVGKPLICLADATNKGIINGALFDANLRRLRLIRAQGDEGECFVEPRYIAETRYDAVIIKDATRIAYGYSPLSEPLIAPLGASVYNQDGVLKGALDDIVLLNRVVLELIVDQKSFSNKNVLSVNNDAVCINDSGKKITVRKTRPMPKASDSLIRAVLHENGSGINTPVRIGAGQTVVTRMPQDKPKSAPAYEFLIGKTADLTIFCDDGSRLIERGGVIDESVISCAKEHGKLIHLALHAK